MRVLNNVIIISAYIFICLPNIYSQTLTAEQIYKNVSDAVVVILAYDYNDELASQGSGVIINDEGYLVTNYHVLAGNERIEAFHNEEIVPYSDIIGIDVERDILILQIESDKISALKIGNSKTLNIGEKVYAIGSPLGFENTISEGIISGLRNYDEWGGSYIQITASISPGSSGGAIVNDKGELIGISTLTAKEGQNINFAIPINDVLDVEIRSYTKDDTNNNYELLYKGNNASEKENYQVAIEYYSLFIKKYPEYADAYFKRGFAKDEFGDDRGAIYDYSETIKIKPDYIKAYINRGIIKTRLKDYRGAVQDYNKAIEIDLSNVLVYYNRGSARGKLKDYDGAIQDYNKAIEIEPNDADSYYNRGIAKYSIGDKTGACLDWNKAGELGKGTAYDWIREHCN